MRSASPARHTCQARAHSRGSAFAGPATTPIGQPAAQPPPLPVLGERAEPARARPEELEDQHRVADVDAELAALAEARRRLRVVAEHLPRRRDLDAAHEVEPRERLHLARADVRHAAGPRRCRRCRRGTPGCVACAASSRSATSRATKRTGSREALGSRAAPAPRRRRRAAIAKSRFSSVSSRRVGRDARPDLDAARRRGRAPRSASRPPRRRPRITRLAERGRQPVPLAGGAGREDHVGAVAVLDHVAHEAALVVLEQLAAAVEHGHDRHREPVPRPGVLDAAQRRNLAASAKLPGASARASCGRRRACRCAGRPGSSCRRAPGASGR